MYPRFVLLALIILFAIPGSARSQANPDPDGVGIYFDLGGWLIETSTVAPFEAVTAYLLISRPSDNTGVSGWEAEVGTYGTAIVPTWTLAGGFDIDPSETGFQVVVGIGESCLPSASTILLATWTGYMMSPVDIIEFTVTGLSGSEAFGGKPGYTGGADPSVLVPLTSLSDPFGTPCAGINIPGVFPGPTYRMEVSIKASNGVLTDDFNVLGFTDDSIDGPDPQDSPAYPRPESNYLRLTFPHPEWDDPAGPDYDIDFRDYYWYFTSSKTWLFRVETDQVGTPVTLTFHSLYIYGSPDNQRLVDLGTGRQVVFDEYEETYEFLPDASGVNFFEFTAGLPSGPTAVAPDAARASIVARPNPFNPQTELMFTSPVAGSATVWVYDVLGRMVTTLEGGSIAAGGQGRVTWQGRDASGREVSSGTYFASLAVDGRVVGEIRKLSLVR